MKRLLLLPFIFPVTVTFAQRLTKKVLLPDAEWYCANCIVYNDALSQLDTIELFIGDQETDHPNCFSIVFNENGKMSAYSVDLKNAAIKRQPVEVDKTTYTILVADSTLSSEAFQNIRPKFDYMGLWNIHTICLEGNPEEKFSIQLKPEGFVRLYERPTFAIHADVDECKWKIRRKNNELVVTLKPNLWSIYEVQRLAVNHLLLIHKGLEIR
jgi:hypothetical protein